jgi:hypothetical protein
MAYREAGVIELQEVLRRVCLGKGLRATARATGIDRKTAKKYVAASGAGRSRPRRGPTDRSATAHYRRERATVPDWPAAGNRRSKGSASSCASRSPIPLFV